ncbi:hypothetical protein GCM10023108_40920 [Saccharopolyspora hordei]
MGAAIRTLVMTAVVLAAFPAVTPAPVAPTDPEACADGCDAPSPARAADDRPEPHGPATGFGGGLPTAVPAAGWRAAVLPGARHDAGPGQQAPCQPGLGELVRWQQPGAPGDDPGRRCAPRPENGCRPAAGPHRPPGSELVDQDTGAGRGAVDRPECVPHRPGGRTAQLPVRAREEVRPQPEQPRGDRDEPVPRRHRLPGSGLGIGL